MQIEFFDNFVGIPETSVVILMNYEEISDDSEVFLRGLRIF